MADVNRGNRPLSPHLTIYRPQFTSILSIFHRVTGVGLAISAALVVWWFAAAATGPEAFATADWVLTSILGDLVLGLSTLALWYHFCTGIRHLIWDSGRMFDLENVQTSAYVVIGVAVVMTLFTFIAF